MNKKTPQVLRRAGYFGQYGRVAKVVVNRNHSTGGHLGGAHDASSTSGSGSGRSGGGLSHETSASAYITFAHKEDARACINAVKRTQNKRTRPPPRCGLLFFKKQ